MDAVPLGVRCWQPLSFDLVPAWGEEGTAVPHLLPVGEGAGPSREKAPLQRDVRCMGGALGPESPILYLHGLQYFRISQVLV